MSAIEDVPTEVGMLKSQGQAKALLVINNKESPIPDRNIFLSQGKKTEMDIWEFPVIFVGSDIGMILKGLRWPVEVKVTLKQESDEVRQGTLIS